MVMAQVFANHLLMRHLNIFKDARSALIRAHSIEPSATVAIGIGIGIGCAMAAMAMILARVRAKRSVFIHQFVEGELVRMIHK